MPENQRHWQGNGGDDPAVELETQLRTLILTNTTTDGSMPAFSNAEAHHPLAASHYQNSHAMEAPDSPLSPRANPSHLDYTSHAEPVRPTGQLVPQSPKTSRRRPNQAQRRQMNAQFTLTPDIQTQRQWHNFQSRPTLPYQRHMVSSSNPQPLSWQRDINIPRSNGSWSGPSHGDTTNISRYSPSTNPHPYQTPPSGGTRQPPGTFHSQRRPYFRPEEIANQIGILEMLCHQVVSSSEIDRAEIAQKEAFRQRIESLSRQVISRYEREQNKFKVFPVSSIELKCFGSLSSGFATKASDMDLGLLSPFSKVQPDTPGSPIPRLLEKALLDAGLGARLLSRTRVPIIKLCQSPPEKLLQGLLEERERWENGEDNEQRDGAEDEHDHDSPFHADDDDHLNPGLADVGLASSSDFEVPCRENGGVQRFRLRQGSKHSLSSYYGLAKRILRRAGGRDVTVSNYKEFTGLDWVILNRVCRAFICGLFDSFLQQRIKNYPSLSFSNEPNLSHHRSFLGVFVQVEGEKILQSWFEWPERKLFHVNQPQDEQTLGLWETLQSKPIFDIDPISYTKDLQLTLDKIKRISSIQLLLLEQGEQETPSQYYARARGIFSSLKFDGEALFKVHQEITSRYISGINQEDMRDAIKCYLTDFPEQSDFQAVGCRHKSFHLAQEFERAVDKNLYDTTTIASINRYIDILRSPLRKQSTGFVVHVPPEYSALLTTIKTLEDPHKMSPNQLRDKYRDPLEFPKMGVGVQCDINFSAHLALQNTHLLRCYSHTDPRVRPMVLFVKHWAKVRGINSGYRGTLSSYGYVLMVLHYLINIAQPFVCPNLQQLAPKPPPHLSGAEIEASIYCRGYNVQFWRDEQQIMQLALGNQLNRNIDSIGTLLRGFFEYFAQNGAMSNIPGRGFDWGRDVISLRTHGGLMTKQEKGWTGAKTIYEVQKPTMSGNQPEQQSAATEYTSQSKLEHKNDQVKEVRLRYLFAIEDPFELDHNVARTVTHNGIVSIRDEFRRAWRIIRATGTGNMSENMLQDINDADKGSNDFRQLLSDIHGLEGFSDAQN